MSSLVLVLTGLALAPLPGLAGDLAHSADPACKGLRFGYHESLAAQGFFGVLTPKASAAVVKKALEAEIAHANSREKNEGEGYGNYEFNWGAVCRLAKSKNLKVLWIGCEGDTEEQEGRFFGSQMSNKNDTVDEVKATCVISTYNKDNSPSWSDLKKNSLIHSGGSMRNIYPRERDEDGDRYDVLKKPEERMRLYMEALAGSVSLLEHEENKKRHPETYWGPTSDLSQPCPKREGDNDLRLSLNLPEARPAQSSELPL